MPEEVRQHSEQLDGRSILVKKAEVIPLEAIVRGYITGEPPCLATDDRTSPIPFFPFF
jgi:phosphoribosylaminoimidazole-succinocarboxamide synthase